MHLEVSRALLSAGVVAGLLAGTTHLHADDGYPVTAGNGPDTGRAVWLNNCRAVTLTVAPVRRAHHITRNGRRALSGSGTCFTGLQMRAFSDRTTA